MSTQYAQSTTQAQRDEFARRQAIDQAIHVNLTLETADALMRILSLQCDWLAKRARDTESEWVAERCSSDFNRMNRLLKRLTLDTSNPKYDAYPDLPPCNDERFDTVDIPEPPAEGPEQYEPSDGPPAGWANIVA